MKEIDYVTLYAESLKENNLLFEQQKMLIESQLKASSSLFTKTFSGDFKLQARSYLRGIGLL